MKSRKSSLALLVLFVLGLGLAFVQAQDDDAPVLAYRQRLMKGQGAGMGSIGDILKYKLPYSADIKTHASNISEYAKLIPGAFEKNIAMGKTDAQAVVWENWDDFTAKAKALEDAAAKLAASAESGEMRAMMPDVKALGEACRGCHDTYRKPREERFER